MASPPYNHNYGTSVSPPYPQHTSLPPSKKRASEISIGTPAVKKRKPSTASSISHPLRQASFPPEANMSARSPSVDTMSLVSGSVAAAPVKSKRGRKPKNRGGDDASIAGGKAATTISTSGKGKGKKADEEADEDEDEGGESMAVATVTRTNEEKEKEKQHRALLVGAFDPGQFSRYEVWRSSRLPDGTVRRLVNQTLSQSVPVGVILAVKSVSKIWAGELIERARKVQSQWLELSQEDQTGGRLGLTKSEDELEYRKQVNKEQRGPLTPEHLREALRRIKMERTGGVGLLGLGRLQHPTGQERFGIKTSGKRLFR